jgi:hypothetical protein
LVIAGAVHEQQDELSVVLLGQCVEKNLAFAYLNESLKGFLKREPPMQRLLLPLAVNLHG